MSNFIARILEKKISIIFDNFQAGKNAKSSLSKGEGQATDLFLNKKFLNDKLPPQFSVVKASCRLLKWKVSLLALGKDPVELTLEGVDVTIEETAEKAPRSKNPPAGHAGQGAGKTEKEKAESKRNAILEGVKIRLRDISVTLVLQHGSAHVTPGAPRPFVKVGIGRISLYSTNSQWQEVCVCVRVRA